MADTKHRFPSRAQDTADTVPRGAKVAPFAPESKAPEATFDNQTSAERRRLSKIVHDHKGTATVEWHDAPEDYERQVLEIEGAHPSAASSKGGFNTDSLSIEAEDTHNPYMRVPGTDRKRAPGQRTDLRKLSAWIKMMRSLEEAKKRKEEDD